MDRLKLILIVTSFLSVNSVAEALSISCGESSGYSHYFGETGLVEDKISGGKTTLTLDDKGNAGIMFVDVTGEIKSVSQQGGVVRLQGYTDAGANWVATYSDGTLLIFSLNFNSMKAVAYTNTVGNAWNPKNSVLISECTYS